MATQLSGSQRFFNIDLVDN